MRWWLLPEGWFSSSAPTAASDLLVACSFLCTLHLARPFQRRNNTDTTLHGYSQEAIKMMAEPIDVKVERVVGSTRTNVPLPTESTTVAFLLGLEAWLVDHFGGKQYVIKAFDKDGRSLRWNFISPLAQKPIPV